MPARIVFKYIYSFYIVIVTEQPYYLDLTIFAYNPQNGKVNHINSRFECLI